MRDADGRTEEIRAEAAAAAQQVEALEAAIAEKEADMVAAAAERELQSGGEVRELQTATDEQSKQCAPLPAGRANSAFASVRHGRIRPKMPS